MVFKTLSFGGYNPHSFSAYASLPALEIMLNVIYRTIKDVNEISEHLKPKRLCLFLCHFFPLFLPFDCPGLGFGGLPVISGAKLSTFLR
jgi:hypothetical protein